VRYEVLVAVKMSMLLLLAALLRGLVGRNQHFWKTYCLHLQGWRWRQYVSLKLWFLPTSPHGVTTQKNNTDNFRILWRLPLSLLHWQVFASLILVLWRIYYSNSATLGSSIFMQTGWFLVYFTILFSCIVDYKWQIGKDVKGSRHGIF
jgi:hypothetical protein